MANLRPMATLVVSVLALTCSARGGVLASSAASGPDVSLTMPRAPETRGMIFIPGGLARMSYSLEETKIEPFFIDQTETTVEQYRRCVEAGACTPAGEQWETCNWPKRSARARHPVNCVTWEQAEQFCRWAKKRLPSEAEWEFAARGAEGRTFPWGEEAPSDQLCWDRSDSADAPATCPVGSHPQGATPEKVLDLAGNVWEWTAGAEILPGNIRGYAIRGGGWSYDPLLPTPDVRAVDREVHLPSHSASDVGFRCAR